MDISRPLDQPGQIGVSSSPRPSTGGIGLLVHDTLGALPPLRQSFAILAPNMPEPLTTEEAKNLLSLCRAGKLYDVEKWIVSGKSLQIPAGIKKTPLAVAIDLGFHSLVELLARYETSQDIKNKGLSDAVAAKRLDLAQLLLERGAEIKSIPLAHAFGTWDPAIIRFFLDKGADVIKGSPFAVAFGEKIRTTLRPYVEYKKAHPELSSELQEQADQALRHFSHEGDLKWVSLMLWAGANPRTLGPTLDDCHENDLDCHTTALREACYQGKLDVLLKLKPDPSRDDLSELLRCAAFFASVEVLQYLLRIGAKPNDKESGGCGALENCFWHLGFGHFDPFGGKRLVSKSDAHGTLECIQSLTEHGALWRPEGPSQLNSVRQTLCKCEPEVTVELMKIVARNKASPEETLEELLDTPRMRAHLSPLGIKLQPAPSGKVRHRPLDSRRGTA